MIWTQFIILIRILLLGGQCEENLAKPVEKPSRRRAIYKKNLAFVIVNIKHMIHLRAVPPGG